jgi:hypothetical protein
LTTPPERQQQLPPPDAPVADETDVYRLVSVDACDVRDGRWEFQSGAFDNSTPINDGERDDEMSVVLGDTLALLDRVPDNLPIETPCAGEPALWGVARLNAGFLKNDMNQSIHRTAKEDELAHGDVRGAKNPKRRKKIKKHATWVIEPAMPAA